MIELEHRVPWRVQAAVATAEPVIITLEPGNAVIITSILGFGAGDPTTPLTAVLGVDLADAPLMRGQTSSNLPQVVGLLQLVEIPFYATDELAITNFGDSGSEVWATISGYVYGVPI